MKNYWSWKCHKCGHDDNRSGDSVCTQCGAKIRCEAAGGHYWRAGETYCDGGCGLDRGHKLHPKHRRPDY